MFLFFNHPFFYVVGGMFTITAVISLLITLVLWTMGIAPLLWRLGLGRWVRKIAIAANAEAYNSLKTDLVDSGIFRSSNISQITKNNLAKIKDHSLILVHYQTFSDLEINELLTNKRSNAGMIFYYSNYDPTTGEKVSDEMVKLISSKENTTIVNFRGRLLNDIVITLITTSYEKR